MKVSIDFDGTLSTKKGQKLARDHIQDGDDLYITTARPESGEFSWGEYYHADNSDLYDIAEEVGIPKSKIRFTNFEPKFHILKDFDVHYDDDEYELRLINGHTDCKGINIEDI
jgi:hypothetical protein